MNIRFWVELICNYDILAEDKNEQEWSIYDIYEWENVSVAPVGRSK